ATTSAGRCFVLSRFVLSRLEKYRRKKNGPETGAISLGGNQRTESKAQPGLRLTVSKSETGEVAIARRDPGAGHQQAVDRGHQAGEQAVGGCEADGSSLGHWGSLSEGGERPVVIWEQSTYTRCQQQCVCLHGSISYFAVQQIGRNLALQTTIRAAGMTGGPEN